MISEQGSPSGGSSLCLDDVSEQMSEERSLGCLEMSSPRSGSDQGFCSCVCHVGKGHEVDYLQEDLAEVCVDCSCFARW